MWCLKNVPMDVRVPPSLHNDVGGRLTISGKVMLPTARLAVPPGIWRRLGLAQRAKLRHKCRIATSNLSSGV